MVRSSTWKAPASTRVLVGDVTEVGFLTQAFEGQQAVLSALGLRLPSIAPWARPEVPDLLTRAGPALIEAAKRCGITRVLAISAGGVGDSKFAVPGFFRFLIRYSGLKHAYAELEVFERTLLASGLEVCLCRPTGLTDEPATGRARVAQSFAGRATIPRADVAAWMLDQVVALSLTERTPMITVTG